MPVHNVDTLWLEKAVKSVIVQGFTGWELCIVDDASSSGGIHGMLLRFAQQDSRIRVVFIDRNQGIAMASNKALAMATGDYLAFLDDDDELHPECLDEVARHIKDNPEVDLLFTDEDKIDLDGNRSGAVIKPDWSPDLFLTYNYLCHLVVCRRELVQRIGGFRAGFDGSQDYDLLLRITEKTDRIIHIPRVLYHWRSLPGSAASRVDAKPYAFERSKKALRDALERRGLDGEVTDGDEVGKFSITIRRFSDQ